MSGKFRKRYVDRLTLMFFYFLIVPITIIIIVFSVNIMHTQIDAQIMQYSVPLDDAHMQFDAYVTEILYKYNVMSHHSTLQKVLTMDSNHVFSDEYDAYHTLRELAEALTSDNNDIVINIYTSNPYITKADMLKDISEIYDKPYFAKLKYINPSGNFYCFENLNENDEAFRIYKRYETGNDHINILEISIPVKKIFKFKRDIYPDDIVVAIRNNRELHMLYWNNAEEVMLAEIDGDIKQYNMTKTIRDGEFDIEVFFPKSVLWKIVIRSVLVCFFAIFLFAILIYRLARYTSKRMTDQIRVVLDVINSEQEKTELFGRKKFDDEFNIILSEYIRLIDRLKDENEKQIKTEKEKSEMEIFLLQEKIAPHFLYNTLTSIRMVSKEKETKNVIDSLVRYYRIALNSGSNITTVRDELDAISEYLKIQEFAYNKKFDYQITCDKELENFKILKNLLQPIAENAFLHGVNRLSDGCGKIRINVYSEGGNIVFSVEDNGPGIMACKVSELFDDNDKKDENRIKKSYALSNISKRIKLFYDTENAISIYSNGTTIVKVMIPKKRCEDV